jgi:hypothetical protein
MISARAHLGETGIEDGVRDLVGDLVGVTLTDRLGGEEEAAASAQYTERSSGVAVGHDIGWDALLVTRTWHRGGCERFTVRSNVRAESRDLIRRFPSATRMDRGHSLARGELGGGAVSVGDSGHCGMGCMEVMGEKQRYTANEKEERWMSSRGKSEWKSRTVASS